MISEQVMIDGAPVVASNIHRIASYRHRTGGFDAGEQRLADPLAGEGVGRHGGIADEEHSSRTGDSGVNARRNRPSSRSTLHLHIGTESEGNVPTGE
jgi:hypothetical protein